MPQVTVRYKTRKSREALQDFAKYFEWELIEEKPSKKKSTAAKEKKDLPVTWAENADVMALAGIWKGRNITQEEIRTKAWGKRR